MKFAVITVLFFVFAATVAWTANEPAIASLKAVQGNCSVKRLANHSCGRRDAPRDR